MNKMMNIQEKNNIFFEHQLMLHNRKSKGFSIPLHRQDDQKIKVQSNNNEDEIESFYQQKAISKNYFLLPQQFPSKKLYGHLQDLIKDFDFDGSIDPYISLIENDPHLAKGLIDLYDLEKKINANPDDQTTILNFSPSILIFFGTGDGSLLKEALQTLKPYNVIIALRAWDDLKSSFDNLDWTEIWNDYCNSENQSISIIGYKDVAELRSVLFNNYLLMLEHSIMLVPQASQNQVYMQDRDILIGDHLEMHVNYLGFTCDEYNMLLNASATLAKSPRIYQKPSNKVGGKYVICGSGPSLDQNIAQLQELAKRNTHNIIACASNFRTLRSAGIDVDILCLLERGQYEYDNYLSVKNEFGVGNTKLFASVTCDSRLHDLFLDSMVFYRPALNPLSLFSTSTDQVLFFEGPQTVNTGVALCSVLQADECILVGVDLGTSSKDYVRSSQAVGSSPREFEISTEGNFEKEVFSTRLLMDGKYSMDKCIATSGLKVINASNGVLIQDTIPISLDQYLIEQKDRSTRSSELLNSWWSTSYQFSNRDQINQWAAYRPRFVVSKTVNDIVSLLESDKKWFCEVEHDLLKILDLSQPIRQQIGSRMLRACVLKLATVITRQCYVMSYQDRSGQLCSEFLPKARRILINICYLIEAEIYDLFDHIESNHQANL